MDEMKGTRELVEIIARYSDVLDLPEAMANAHSEYLETMMAADGLTPLMVKLLVDVGVQARFDMLTSVVVSALAQAGDWKIDQFDQEKEALKDAMLLVKHHTERQLLEMMIETEEEDDE